MPTVLENGSKLLKVDPLTFQRFEKQQKCAFAMESDLFIFGEVIHQLLSKNKQPNPLKVVSGIFTNVKSIDDTVNLFFDSPKKISKMDQISIFMHNDGIDAFYFIPEFDPNKLNDEYGFTIDQVYYSPHKNTLIDTSGRGVADFTSLPVIIKSTSSSDKWDKITLMSFLSHIGFFYDSEISDEDMEKLKSMQHEKPYYLHNLLRLNRPGSSLKCFCDICPQAKLWLFDMIIDFLGKSNIRIKENVRPSQVFTEEKFNLLNLYSDYFNTSGSPQEKRNRDSILAKLLVDI